MNINTVEHYDQLWSAFSVNYKRDLFHVQRFKFVAGLCVPGTTLLDVAAGPGFISEYLPPGIRYERLDFCEPALKSYPGIYYVSDVLSDDPLPAPFHTVLAMEILEHLDDPAPLVQKCIDAALFQVIFTVPNNRLPPEVCPEHVHVWDRNSFSSFMLSACSGLRLIFHTTEANIICQIMI